MPFLGQQPAEVALTTGDLGDDIVTLAKLAGGTDGNLITYDASGDPAAVAVGTAGHFLKSQGAGSVPVFAAAGGGWGFVSTLTASTTASLSFTNMADGYDYLYVVEQLFPATDNATFDAELGVAGPTYRTSGYDDAGFRVVTATNAVNANQPTARIELTTIAGCGSAADEGIKVIELTLINPANASIETPFIYSGGHTDNSAVSYTCFGFGHYTTAEAHTSIIFTFNSGNITSGTIQQYRRSRS